MKKNFTKILTLFLTFIMLSAVPAMAYSNDPYPNSYLPLTDFNIISYGSDGGTTYWGIANISDKTHAKNLSY